MASERSLWSRIKLAHRNLQATTAITNIAFLMDEDFYTFILKAGYTTLSAAAEAVYFNEEISVSMAANTWLERGRREELEKITFTRYAPARIPGAKIPVELHSDMTGNEGFGLVDGEPELGPDGSRLDSGYARERKTTKEVNKAGAEATKEAGVGVAQRSARWFTSARFAQEAMDLLSYWWARFTISMLQRSRRRYSAPKWLQHLARLPEDTGTGQELEEKSKVKDFWLVSESGKTSIPETLRVDVEAELQKRYKRSGTEVDLDDELYNWWKSNGWWGESDSSGAFRPPSEIDDDLTSVVSDATACEAASSASTPLGSREVTPTPGNTGVHQVDEDTTARIAELLDPKTLEDKEEARMLSHHLRGTGPMTRNEFRRRLFADRTRILSDTPLNRLQSDREDEETVLEQMILSRLRERRKNVLDIHTSQIYVESAMMGKRKAETSKDVPIKRPKVIDRRTETITNATQLQKILTFRENDIDRFKAGIRSFKQFLDSILYAKEKSETLSQLEILKDCIASQKPKEDGSLFFPSLMQGWDYAAHQTPNIESLMSAIPAVLALLFRTISTQIEFREDGLLLSKTILQQSNLKLISWGLNAAKQKQHLISPCLRLLTEVLSFNGGSLASRVFTAKTLTFDAQVVSRNLSLWHTDLRSDDDRSQSSSKPSVRSNTVHYLSANLSFLPSAQKLEVLKCGNVFRTLFAFCKYDSPETLQEIFEALKKHVLSDDNVPRSSRRYILYEYNLSNISSVYQKTPESTEDTQTEPAQKLAYDFLQFVCTTPSAGVLNGGSGWYPPLDEPDNRAHGTRSCPTMDLGLDSIDWYAKFKREVPVRNKTLSRFIQDLKPYSNLKDRNLMLKIFKAAPELVAEYFFNKASFNFDPKPTSTWTGYTSFLSSVIQLPVPNFFGRSAGFSTVPPPDTIAIESILPQPLNQKALTRCLNHSVDLIKFFGINLIAVAFQKLRTCLDHFQQAAKEQGGLWEEGSSRLVAEFSSRCPSFKDIFNTLQTTPNEKVMQREAIFRLLSLYHQVIPELAEAQFDVSQPLNQSLQRFEKLGVDEQMDKSVNVDGTESESQSHVSIKSQQLEIIKLNHALQIARLDLSSTRWWNAPQSLRYSPFITLLRIVTRNSEEVLPAEMKQLLESVVEEHDIFQNETQPNGLHLFVASLEKTLGWAPTDDVFDWLNDLLARNARNSLKYLDDLDESIEKANNPAEKPISVVWMVIKEQWSFAMSRKEPHVAEHISTWVGRYLGLCIAAGESEHLLKLIFNESLIPACTDQSQESALSRRQSEDEVAGILDPFKRGNAFQRSAKTTPPSTHVSRSNQIAGEVLSVDPSSYAPPESEPSSKDIHWPLTGDVGDVINNGSLSTLMLCLSSSHQDVRSQAFRNLNLFVRRFEKEAPASSLMAHSTQVLSQIELVLGILTNTATKYRGIDDLARGHEVRKASSTPLPYVITGFAAVAVQVLRDPLHPLYPKMNRFLLRDPPSWDDPGRLLSFWVHAILRSSPDEDERATNHAGGNRPPGAGRSSGASHPSSIPLSVKRDLQHESGPLGPPESVRENATAYNTGVHFLLSYLYHALRTSDDLDVIRSRGVFETVFALAASSSASWIKEMVLKLVWRATWIREVDESWEDSDEANSRQREGAVGSTTLITRAGVISFLENMIVRQCPSRKSKTGSQGDHTVANHQSQLLVNETPKQLRLDSPDAIRQLVKRLWDTCDQGRVGKSWSSGIMDKIVARIDEGAEITWNGLENRASEAADGESSDQEEPESDARGDIPDLDENPVAPGEENSSNEEEDEALKPNEEFAEEQVDQSILPSQE
ncbi:MAG: hypothetical protein M1831_007075 [Alyxoria varia]|nr:MAG: hypothetical protein M1831_007075 [Alyxoria varia]